MAEGTKATDQKGLTKRQAAVAPGLISKEIKLPGGNTISHDQPLFLTIAPPPARR